MSRAHPTSLRRRLLLCSLLAALAVSAAACQGGPADQAAEGPSASPTTTAPTRSEASASPSPTTESPTVSPSEQPGGSEESPAATPTSRPSTTVEATEEEPEAAPVQPPPPGSGPREMLLGRRQVPGLNQHHGWRLVRTENTERRSPVWACQVTDFASIGATEVWVRRFVGQPGDGSARARSAVISFVDAISARRAYAVLRAWHDRCEEELVREYDRVRVDAAPTAVDVARGQAEWRLAVYGPVPGDREASFFDATGYVRKGTRISLTTIVSAGQDYDYPRGQEPIVEAVANSAVKLLG